LAIIGVLAFALASCSSDDGSSNATVGDDGSRDVADSEGAVPFRLLPVESPPSIPSDSALRDLSVEVVSAPEEAEPGETLEFVVSINNPTAEPVQLEPCPAYFANFGESSITTRPVLSLLNCEAADPIPPSGAERFAMEIELTEDLRDLRLDFGSIFWRLEPSITAASSEQIPLK
jgi:hypothetical protein